MSLWPEICAHCTRLNCWLLKKLVSDRWKKRTEKAQEDDWLIDALFSEAENA